MHAFVHASKVDIPPSCSNPYWGNLSKIVLWDDPLLGMCAPFLGTRAL